jgi:hypothetical protein
MSAHSAARRTQPSSIRPAAGDSRSPEDCAVCCRPNLITFTFDEDGDVRLDATQEYEA